MKSEFKECKIYSYPYHAIYQVNFKRYIVISPSEAWDYENNEMCHQFDEAVMRQYSGVLTLKFP